MKNAPTNNGKTVTYHVKNIAPAMIGSGVRPRLFTLASGDMIPWHCHRKTADHYFVLQGELTVSTREPEHTQAIGAGHNYRIEPGRPHRIANRSEADCQFLLLQGVGTVDWVKIET